MDVKSLVRKYDLKESSIRGLAFNAIKMRGVRVDQDVFAQAVLGICEGLAMVDPARVNHAHGVMAFVKLHASNYVRRHTDAERRAYRAASAVYGERSSSLSVHAEPSVDERLDGSRELRRALRAFDAAVLAEAGAVLLDASSAVEGSQRERAAAARWDLLAGKDDVPAAARRFVGTRLAERMAEAGYPEVDRALCLELLETHNLSRSGAPA